MRENVYDSSVTQQRWRRTTRVLFLVFCWPSIYELCVTASPSSSSSNHKWDYRRIRNPTNVGVISSLPQLSAMVGGSRTAPRRKEISCGLREFFLEKRQRQQTLFNFVECLRGGDNAGTNEVPGNTNAYHNSLQQQPPPQPPLQPRQQQQQDGSFYQNVGTQPQQENFQPQQQTQEQQGVQQQQQQQMNIPQEANFASTPLSQEAGDPFRDTFEDRVDSWRNYQREHAQEQQESLSTRDEQGRLKLLASVSQASRAVLFFLLMWRNVHLYDLADKSTAVGGLFRGLVLASLSLLFLLNLSGFVVSLATPSRKSKKRLKAILNLDKLLEILLIFYNLSRLTLFPSKLYPREIYMGGILHALFFLLQCQGITKLAWDIVDPAKPGNYPTESSSSPSTSVDDTDYYYATNNDNVAMNVQEPQQQQQQQPPATSFSQYNSREYDPGNLQQRQQP